MTRHKIAIIVGSLSASVEADLREIAAAVESCVWVQTVSSDEPEKGDQQVLVRVFPDTAQSPLR